MKKKSTLEDFRYYFRFFSPYRSEVLWAVFFFVLKHLPFIITPIAIMMILDNFIPRENMQPIIVFVVALAVYMLSNIFYHQAYVLVGNAGFVKKVNRDIRNTIVNKLQLLSAGFNQGQESGKVFSKVMVDVEKLDKFTTMFLNQVLTTAVTFIFSFSVLSIVNFQVFLTYILFIPAYVILYRFFIKRLRKAQHQSRLSRENLNASYNSFLNTLDLSRMHALEDYELKRIKDKARVEYNNYRKLETTNAFFGPIISVLGKMMVLTVVVVAAVNVIQNRLTIGEMILFVQFITFLIENVTMILNIFPMFIEFGESISSVQEILNSPDEEYNSGKPQAANIKGNVDFNDVSFSHTADKDLFEHLNLHIYAGESIALVGESGSGKTTFVNLLLGLYRAQRGKILIDDYAINDTDMRSIRKQVGVVTQDAILFNGTIRENIVHENTHLEEEKIHQAAKYANAYQFVMRMEKGFDTQIGEGGVQLSGGQAQRICIARAILRQPKILVLDEATSALDSESEEEVQKVLESLQGRQTTIMIAHRLSTIVNADRILVFKQGEIIEQGNHSQLLALGGEYAELYALQVNSNVKDVQRLGESQL